MSLRIILVGNLRRMRCDTEDNIAHSNVKALVAITRGMKLQECEHAITDTNTRWPSRGTSCLKGNIETKTPCTLLTMFWRVGSLARSRVVGDGLPA